MARHRSPDDLARLARARGSTPGRRIGRVMGPLALAALAAAVLGPAPTRAAANDADTAVVTVPEVVVRALRGEDRLREIPAAAFVISRADLARAAAPRISSLLQDLPGLYGYQSSASGDPTVVDPRGFTANGESSYLKVLVDGRDTRDLENGNVDWDWVGTEGVERVEVVEGPGAWVYGDGAEGGIVNIVRAVPRPGLAMRSTLRGGSFDQRGGSLGVNWGASPWAASLDGGGRDVEGWRDRSHERVRNAHALASWRRGEATTLSFDTSWLEAYREDPGALTPDEMAADRTQAQYPDDQVVSERVVIGLDLTHGDPQRSQWTLAPYARIEDFEQVRTIDGITMVHPTTGATLGGDLRWRAAFDLAGRPCRVAAGYGLERAELKGRYYDGLPGPRRSYALVGHGEATRLTHAGFASAQLELTPAILARGGVRVDAIRAEFDDRLTGTSEGPRTMAAASPFAALSVRRGAAMAYASVTAAFHAPTLNQLYDRRPFIVLPFPPFTISNGDLDPQRSWSYEIGGRWDAPSGYAASLTYYDIYVKDEIDFDLTTFAYANLAKSRHAGVVASGWAPLHPGIRVFAGATLSPTIVQGGDNDGNQINAVPIGSALGRVEWTPAPWAAVDAGVRWVGRQFLDKENDHPLGEYATVDLGGSLRYGRARFSLRVANLLDRSFADTGYIGPVGEERLVPAAGRSVVAAIGFE